MATQQVKNAIKKLLAADLERSEFSVRVERLYAGIHPDTGKQSYEYGDANILIWSKKERQIKLAPMIAKQGLHVELIKLRDGSDGVPYVSDSWRRKPGLFLRDYTKLDKYGLSSITSVTS